MTHYRLRYRQYWLILSIFIIFIVSSLMLLPSHWFFHGDDQVDSQIIDKIFHAFVYFFLVLWFSGQYKMSFTFFLVISLYGVLIEFIQYFIPYRSAELMDIFSNQIGVITGVVFSTFSLGGWSKKFESYFF